MNYLFTLLFFFTAGWSNLLSVPQVSVKATAFANMNDYQMEGYLDAQRKKGTQVRIDPSSAQAVVVQRIESRTDLTEPAGALSGREAPEVHGQKEGAPDQPTTKTPSTTGTGSGTSSSSSGTEPVTTPQTPTKPTTP